MQFPSFAEKIRQSLFWRIALMLLLVFILVGISYTFITITVAKSYADETTQRLNDHVAANLLKHVHPFVNGKVNKKSLEMIMESMMAVNPGLEVYILDPQGQILSSVVLHEQVNKRKINIEPIKAFLKTPREPLIYGDDPCTRGKSKIFSAAPVYEDGKLQGYVYLILASQEFDTIASMLQQSYLLKMGMRSLAVTLIATFVFSLILLWLLMRSLREIVSTVKRFSVGDLGKRIPLRCKGELTELSKTINNMADTIVRNMDSLKEIDKLRRDLIANISHDIRTPISVIHGYAETLIIKQDDLNEIKQHEYLSTILKSTEKLKSLVADLFELSKLESRQIKPKIETFYISDLIKDLIHRYKLLAQKKNLVLKAQFLSTIELVSSDMSMIERVLQNLVDNAIHYSDENGDIRIIVENYSENLYVSVTNSGREIPPNDLPRIFDRYYKVETKSFGTGLGLAIVKNILDLLGSEITVRSENFMTTFSFNLPTVQQNNLIMCED